MMGHQQVERAASSYEFSLERHVPANHLLRSIDRFVEPGELIFDVEPTAAIRQAEVLATKRMIERAAMSFALHPSKLLGDSAYGSAKMPSWLVDPEFPSNIAKDFRAKRGLLVRSEGGGICCDFNDLSRWAKTLGAVPDYRCFSGRRQNLSSPHVRSAPDQFRTADVD